jgi:peroxiredoxin Q/BCP
MGLKKGDSVPLFTLPDQEGKLFSISDHIGKQPLVIYFYPKDNTPGCTKEACDFRDRYQDFQELGAEVIGISSDSTKSHNFFSAKYGLPFILLSDKDNRVRKQFKIKNSLLLLPGRETFVVDKSGTIIMAFNSISAAEHMKRALKALYSLKE